MPRYVPLTNLTPINHIFHLGGDLIQVILVSLSGNAYEGFVRRTAVAGRFECTNGDYYVGGFSGNRITGFGTMTYSNGQMLTGRWMDSVLIMDINAITDYLSIPPTTQTAKIDIPDFGPSFEVFTTQDTFCGVKAVVRAISSMLSLMFKLVYHSAAPCAAGLSAYAVALRISFTNLAACRTTK